MAQRTTGIRSLLGRPAVYDVFQRLISKSTTAAEIERLYLPFSASGRVRVLDIGCGTGHFLRHYGGRHALEYVGIDPSAAYIAACHSEFGERGTFIVGTTETVDRASLGAFDLVVAMTVLHHLDDRAAVALTELAAEVLRPDGRLVAVDNCFVEGQHPIARWLARQDRGTNVRTADGYASLCISAFRSVETFVHSDWLRLPYNHCVTVATGPIRRGEG